MFINLFSGRQVHHGGGGNRRRHRRAVTHGPEGPAPGFEPAQSLLDAVLHARLRRYPRARTSSLLLSLL